MKDFDEIINRDQTSIKYLVNALCVLLLISDVILGYIYYKNINDEKKDVAASAEKFKESKYTLTELYNMIERDEVADDALDILANWYDYFSKDTIFKNKFGDEYNYNEYESVKALGLKDRFVVTILNTKKNDVILLLTK